MDKLNEIAERWGNVLSTDFDHDTETIFAISEAYAFTFEQAKAIPHAPSDIAYLLGEVERLNRAIAGTIQWAKETGEAKEAEQYHDELRAPFNHGDEPRGYARACEDVAEMLIESLRPEVFQALGEPASAEGR